MKKIALLVLALVLALGTLGVAYARWSDTVLITGQVDTGTVKLGILNQGTNDDGTTGKTADPQCGIGVNTEGRDVAKFTSTNDGAVKCTIGEGTAAVNYYGQITETFTDVYPWYGPSTTDVIANCGSIPVKIWYYDLTGSSDPVNIMSFVTITWDITLEDGTTHVTGSGTLVEFLDALKGIQIAGGKSISIAKKICFNEEAGGATLPQGKSASLTLTLYATQWNEYP